VTGIYTRVVGLALRGSVVVLVVYGGLMVLTWWTFNRLPTGYIPNQDSRRLFAAVQLPDSASLERTKEVVDLVARIAQGDPEFGGKYQSPAPKQPALYTLTREAMESLRAQGAPETLALDLERYVEKDWARRDLEDILEQDVKSDADRTNFQNLLANYGKLTSPALRSLRSARAPESLVADLQLYIDTDLAKDELEGLLQKDVASEQERMRFRNLLAKYGTVSGDVMASLRAAEAPSILMADLRPYIEKDLAAGELNMFLKKDVADDTVRESLRELLADYGKKYLGIPGVDHTIAVAGQSFTLSANGSNFGNLFITLDDFGKPGGSRKSSDEILAKLQTEVDKELPKQGKSAVVKFLGPPPVSGLGNSGGFKFIVEDRSGDNDLVKLQEQTDNLIQTGNDPTYKLTDLALDSLPESAAAALEAFKGKPMRMRDLTRVLEKEIADKDERTRVQKLLEPFKQPPLTASMFTVFRAKSPQLYVDLNRKQCETLGVNPGDVFTTLQVYLGSFYVNDFNKFGRTWQVVVQAEGPFRNDIEQVKRQKVRSAGGNMVPLGSVLDIREIEGPLLLMRYNMYPAAAVVGATAPGVSSGDGIKAMERLGDRTLPKQSMGYEWTEINFIEVDAAKNIWNNLIFPLAVVFVFLVLAAQYESWALPLAVILVVPMCLLGSLAGVAFTRTQIFADLCKKIGIDFTSSDINIFTQIGFVVLVGLASKNAILIVEFAKHKVEEGLSRREATLAACKLRLRPILMTSFAFILGVVPLILATGAGHEMRQRLGTAVFSGMLGVTLFGIFLTPVFFYVIEWFVERPVFASDRVRMYRKVLGYVIGVASLGLIWLVPWLGRVMRRPKRATPAPVNGRLSPSVKGDGAASGDGASQSEVIRAADNGPRSTPRK
jgi:multidrug efflux pump subunit AcrB